METRAGGEVIIEVRVMHAMQTPQHGNRMYHHVLQPDGEIKRKHREQACQPARQIKVVQHAPALTRSECRHADRCSREQHAQEQCIENDQSEIIAPAQRLGSRQGAARCPHFPGRHEREDAEKRTTANQQFVGEEQVSHRRLSSACQS